MAMKRKKRFIPWDEAFARGSTHIALPLKIISQKTKPLVGPVTRPIGTDYTT